MTLKKILPTLFVFNYILISCVATKDIEKQSKDLYEQKEYRDNEIKSEILVAEKIEAQPEKEIIYIEKPVYIPNDSSNENQKPKEKGTAAVRSSLEKAIIKPEQYKAGTFFYTYNENFVYEIYAQPYKLTDIILEEGEEIINKPLFSEDESVWELTAGVEKSPAGLDIQHLFVKPADTKLDSSLIIITNRRVYHFRMRSFSDTHMAMVRFRYPLSNNVWAKSAKTIEKEKQSEEYALVKPMRKDLISYDYKIKTYGKKPDFLPKIVYDDGLQTYIYVDDIVMQKKLPVIFNEKWEIVNYVTKNNLIIIPRLVSKVTLRLGKKKVVVEKKKTSKSKRKKIELIEESYEEKKTAQNEQNTEPQNSLVNKDNLENGTE